MKAATLEHYPWCEDRAKPAGQGHPSEGVRTCASPAVTIGGSPVHLVEARTGNAVHVQINETEYTIPQAVALASAVIAVINTLGGAE